MTTDLTATDLLNNPLENLRPHVVLIEQIDLGTCTRCVIQIGHYPFKRIQDKQYSRLDTNGRDVVVSIPIWLDSLDRLVKKHQEGILEYIFTEYCVLLPEEEHRKKSSVV